MNTADTIQVSDKLMAGLQGFVTLVNDPHQIKAFYDLHETCWLKSGKLVGNAP